jgi:hypothetical protein
MTLEAPLDHLLRPIRGPTHAEVERGRDLLVSRLQAERSANRARRGGFARPAAFLFGGLAFGAFTLGAAASSGIGLDGTVSTLLAELGVPGVAQEKTEGSPADVNPDAGDPAPADAAGATESAPLAEPQAAPEGTQGAEVSEAVSEAIGSTAPGPARGEEVRETACSAATTLPPQAQGQGSPPANCAADGPGNGNQPQDQGSGPPENPGPPVNPGQGSPPADPGHGGGPPESPGPPAGPGQGNGAPEEPGPPEDPGQGNGLPENPGAGKGGNPNKP